MTTATSVATRVTFHQYGKSHVRVLKVLRAGPVHTIKELDVAVTLTGDFESSYTSGDNSLVVATDTMKNTVNVLAKQHLCLETERFAVTLAEHFLSKYPQVEGVLVETSERVWNRVTITGAPHPHTFSAEGGAIPTVRVAASRELTSIRSGIRDFLVLKSAGSGFEKFPRCEYTTLPETADRILATSLDVTWDWSASPGDFLVANATIKEALLRPFAENYSPSVQTTLFQMGEAALAVCPEVQAISLSAPNKHCLLIDLSRFGLENPNELFVPTDEPHGQIEVTVSRAIEPDPSSRVP